MNMIDSYLILLILAIAMLIFMATVFYTSVNARLRHQEEGQTKHKQPIKTGIDSGDVIDVLDWMLAQQIIDVREYNKIMGKCLPYLQ